MSTYTVITFHANAAPIPADPTGASYNVQLKVDPADTAEQPITLIGRGGSVVASLTLGSRVTIELATTTD